MNTRPASLTGKDTLTRGELGKLAFVPAVARGVRSSFLNHQACISPPPLAGPSGLRRNLGVPYSGRITTPSDQGQNQSRQMWLKAQTTAPPPLPPETGEVLVAAQLFLTMAFDLMGNKSKPVDAGYSHPASLPG